MTPQPVPPTGNNRREFLTASAASVAAAALGGLRNVAHAGGGDTIRVGLLGCGGRGTGAATQALNADPNAKLVAMGDAFEDNLKASLDTLRRDGAIAAKVAVKPDACFVGFDAYKQVLAAGVDVVLLTTPPHFRPLHLQAAVDAGKHVFCEKPVAVDAPGVRRVMEACRQAAGKKLSVVSGLCYRYELAKRETMQRVHDGMVGDVVALHTNYNTHGLWHKDRKPGWSDMEWQLRNWLYFTWLSGDHIVEQHVHSLDKMAWAMKDEPPVRAFGLGGRQVRTDPAFGHIFDHHAVCFEYANGVKLFSYCRQQDGTKNDVSDYVMGTKGTAEIMRHVVHDRSGKTLWRAKKAANDDMYQNEHDELFAAIRSGKPINNGDYMCKSTLLGIMGRMATYTGRVITWDMAMNSKEDLSPKKYEFGSLPTPPVPMPGVTEFA